MNALFSRNVAALTPSATLAVSAAAARLKAEGVNVVDLGAGEPDFPTPKVVAEAGIRATEQGKTKYAANEGILPLRAAIARRLSLLSGGRAVNADNIVVSNGAKQSVFNACFALFGLREKVLIPTPAWTSYPQIVHLSRATPVEVAGESEWSLKVSVQNLENEWDDAVKGLIMNSPCNPTGAVYTRPELEALMAVAVRHNLYVLSDEIYENLVYDGIKATCVATLGPEAEARTIVVSGFSKTYSMTGWRLGTLVGPAPIAKAVAELQSQMSSNATTFAQYGALAALREKAKTKDSLDRMLAAFNRRRLLLHAGLSRIPGIRCLLAQGAFYLFPNVSSFGMSSMQFCEALLEKEKVAAVPGSAFGAEGHLRMSYATSDETIEKGLARLANFCNGLRR